MIFIYLLLVVEWRPNFPFYERRGQEPSVEMVMATATIYRGHVRYVIYMPMTHEIRRER